MNRHPLHRHLILFAVVALLGGCQAQQMNTAEKNAVAAAAAVEANKVACQHFFDMALSQGDLTVVDSLVAAEAVDHEPKPPGYPSETIPALKKFITDWRTAFPDLKFTVDKMVGEGNQVVIYSTMTGTNTGSFMGMKPTGKSIKVEAFDLVRIENGKMVEHWGVTDNNAMMMQLGMLKPGGMK
jgi:predicted SnoaL-like aldol condensation-catalyzing enzyme